MLLWLLALQSASAIELTPETWESATKGQVVFVKLYGRSKFCQAMKPAWEKLEEDYALKHELVVAKMDCSERTPGHKAFCEKLGLMGVPTILHGKPDALEHYRGGRDYEELAEFAESLWRMCTPETRELCTPAEAAMLDEFASLSLEELDARLAAVEAELAAVEDNHAKAKATHAETANDMHLEKMKKTKALKSDLSFTKKVYAELYPPSDFEQMISNIGKEFRRMGRKLWAIPAAIREDFWLEYFKKTNRFLLKKRRAIEAQISKYFDLGWDTSLCSR
jgi:uncharacterized small protein (DUF1192 family)